MLMARPALTPLNNPAARACRWPAKRANPPQSRTMGHLLTVAANFRRRLKPDICLRIFTPRNRQDAQDPKQVSSFHLPTKRSIG